MKIRLFVGLVLGSLLLGGCSVFGIGGSAEDETQSPSESSEATTDLTTLGNADPILYDQVTLDYLVASQDKARGWHADASLHAVSIELPSDLAVDQATETFIFGSAQEPAVWWTYSVSEATSSILRAEIPKEDYLGTAISPAQTQYWKMNYVQAFQLAETNGGADFRSANPGTTVTLFLSHREPRQWLWWHVEYAAQSGETFNLLINPNRGEVVDEQGNELAPPTTETDGVTPIAS